MHVEYLCNAHISIFYAKVCYTQKIPSYEYFKIIIRLLKVIISAYWKIKNNYQIKLKVINDPIFLIKFKVI